MGEEKKPVDYVAMYNNIFGATRKYKGEGDEWDVLNANLAQLKELVQAELDRQTEASKLKAVE